jgi:competence protein ComEA
MEPMAPDWRTIGSATQSAPEQHGPGRRSPSLGARYVAVIAGAFLATVLLGASMALLLMPATGGVIIETSDGADPRPADVVPPGGTMALVAAGPASTMEPRALVVDVEGAVVRPGLVRVPAGARVGDAIDLAGGFAPTTDLAAAARMLNLAQEVTDGLKIVVPAIGDGLGSGDGRSGADTPDGSDQAHVEAGLVDLNLATDAELDTLPGVGPATIAKIVAAREESPFRSVDELRGRGIVGEATFGKLRDLVTVGR